MPEPFDCFVELGANLVAERGPGPDSNDSAHSRMPCRSVDGDARLGGWHDTRGVLPRGCRMSVIVVPGMAALKQHVNAEVGVSEYVNVTQARIQQFADVTEDWQWIHTDLERAQRESPFGRTVAHGFLTLAFLSRFLAEVVRVEGARLLVSCGLNSVRFLNPVPAEARIRARVRLRECAEASGYVEATWRMTIECEGSRLPSCIADWVVRYYE